MGRIKKENLSLFTAATLSLVGLMIMLSTVSGPATAGMHPTFAGQAPMVASSVQSTRSLVRTTSSVPGLSIPNLPIGKSPGENPADFGVLHYATFLGISQPPRNGGNAFSSPYRGSEPLAAGPLSYSNGTVGFTGLNDKAPNNCLCTPPDTSGSAGNGYVFETVNAAGQIWSTAGTNLSSFNLQVLFKTTESLSDPNIHYDPMSGRWFAEIISVTNYGNVMLAVSTSGDPTGTWNAYVLNMPNHSGTSGDLPDQINVGVSTNTISLSGNDFPGGGSFAGAVIFIVNKTQAVAGTSPAYTIVGPWAPYISVHAAESLTSTDTIYFAGSCAIGTSSTYCKTSPVTTLNYLTLQGSPPSTYHFTFKNFTTSSTNPGSPKMPNGRTAVANDNRMGSAVWRAGNLWGTSMDGTCSGGSASCVHLWEINTTTQTKVQDFVWTPPSGAGALYPAVTLDSSNNLGLLYSFADSSDYPSVAVTGADNTALTTILTPTTVKTGTAAGSANTRFGDYSGAATDLSTGTMWGFGEWTGTGGSTGGNYEWDTWVQSWKFAPPSSSTVPVSFLETGLPAGTNWTVTFNSQIHQSTGLNITFNESAGTYSYTVTTPIAGTPGFRYVDASPTGSLTVGSTYLTQSVTFGTQYHLTTSASPTAGGSVSVSPTGNWQASGASVTLTATANGGYIFTTWAGNGTGSYSGTTDPYTISSMSGPVTEVADFTASGGGTVPVTFLQTTLPASTLWSVYLGGQVNSTTGQNITFNVTAGSYAYSVPTISFGPGEQYLPTPASGSLSISAHTKTTIVFTTQYYLTTSANPSADGTVTPASAWENKGASVTITAAPGGGFALSSWSGTGTGSYSGTALTTTITMNGAIAEIANFQPLAAGAVPVTFLETGVPAATSWSVVFAGLYGSSTGANITFNLTAATDSYSVATVSLGVGTQYVPTPASGTLTFSKHTTQPVAFAAQYYLTTSANPSTGGTATPASGWQASGAVVTITATPGGGYAFASWSGSGTGSYSGTLSSTTVTMNNPIDEIANFQTATNTVPVSFLETGLPTGTFWSATFNSVTLSSYGLNITFNVTASTYAYAIPGVSGGSGTQYAPAPASGSLTITKHTSTTVSFTKQYYLTTSANPSAGGSAAPASGWKNAASSVTISAVPTSGYTFTGWSGTGTGSYSGTSGSTSITMSGPITEIANFGTVPNTVPVGFLESGLPAGTFWSATFNGVTSSSYGLNITFNVTTGTYPYAVPAVSGGSGTEYAPSPSSGSLAVTGHTSQAVGFAEMYYLTMSANPAGEGTVSPSSGWVSTGSTVPILATAAGGFAFVSWFGTGNGNYSGAASSTSITMNGPITEIGNFATATPGNVPISFLESGLPAGTSWSVTLGGVYAGTATGQNITFNATKGTYSYAVATVTTGAGIQYVPAPASGSLAVTGHVTQAVAFSAHYYLTTQADPATDGTASPSSAWFASGSSFAVTESPNPGYTFVSWSGTGTGSYSGTSPSPTITMSGPITEIANFAVTSSGPIPVSFLESGLPGGTLWSVTFGGYAGSSTGLNITFNVTGGTYTFTVGTVSPGPGNQFAPTPAAGSLTVSGRQTQSLSFVHQYYLTLSANPASGGAVSPASGWQNAGAAVGIQATPNAGYALQSWSGSGNGNYSGTAAFATITVNGPITEIANFVVLVSGTVPVSFLESGLPAGTAWSVTLNGVTGGAVGSNITFNVTSGSYTYSVGSPIGVGPWQRYASSGSGTITVSTSHVSQPVTYVRQVLLTTRSNPVGAGSVSPATEWVANGSSVPLNATPQNGNWLFSNWFGTGPGEYTGTSSSTVIKVTASVNETANYSYAYQVTIKETGLPLSSTGWWFILWNGNFLFLTTTSFFLNVTNGTYSFQVFNVSNMYNSGIQYAPSPATGSLTVSGAPNTQAVVFTTQVYLKLSAFPPTGGTTSPATGWYNQGSVVTLGAVPNATFSFGGWWGSGSGNYTGSSASPTITLNGPITETAAFQAGGSSARLSFVETGLGPGATWSVVLDGVARTSTGANITFNVTVGAHGYYIPSVTASPGTRFVVSSPAPSGTVTVGSSGTSVPVAFTTQFQVTTSASPAGGGVAGPATGWVNASAVIMLTATPNIGYSFSAWVGTGTGAYSGSGNPASVTVVAGINETAQFVLAQTYTVSLAATGLATGTSWWVTLDGQNVSGSSTIQFSVSDGTYSYAVESPVPGAAGVRYVAAQTSGSVTVNGMNPATIPVAYSTQYLVATSVTPSQSGTVLPGNAWVNAGSSVTLTAYPFSGYAFSAWSGTYNGPNNPVTVTAGGPVTEKARFSSLSSWIAGTVDPAGASLKIDNVTIQLNASGGFNYTLVAGHHFVEVSESGYQTATLRVFTTTGSGVGVKISLLPTSAGSTTTSVFAASLFPLLLLLLLVIIIVVAVLGYLIGRKRKKEPVSVYTGAGTQSWQGPGGRPPAGVSNAGETQGYSPAPYYHPPSPPSQEPPGAGGQDGPSDSPEGPQVGEVPPDSHDYDESTNAEMPEPLQEILSTPVRK